MSCDLFDIYDTEIQDEHLEIGSILSSTTAVVYTKFEVDMCNTVGNSIRKWCHDLFVLNQAYLETRNGHLNFNRYLSHSWRPGVMCTTLEVPRPNGFGKNIRE